MLTERWHCSRFDALLSREWENEFFIFDPASGDTHVLNALSMKILRLLSEKPLLLENLINNLDDLPQHDSKKQIQQLLDLHLRQLDAMGLIVPSPSAPDRNRR